MKKRTKLFAAMLACAMLAACGRTNTPSSSQSQADTSKHRASPSPRTPPIGPSLICSYPMPHLT